VRLPDDYQEYWIGLKVTSKQHPSWYWVLSFHSHEFFSYPNTHFRSEIRLVFHFRFFSLKAYKAVCSFHCRYVNNFPLLLHNCSGRMKVFFPYMLIDLEGIQICFSVYPTRIFPFGSISLFGFVTNLNNITNTNMGESRYSFSFLFTYIFGLCTLWHFFK